MWAHQDQVVDLELDGGVVTTTEDHPFWNASDREWQRADELDAGETVLTADGDLIAVEGIDWATRTGDIAYNLTVADLHTYFVVVGGEDVLVHNKCVNLSAWNNMTKNWNHIFNQHMPGGSTGNNTLFLGMTENQVKRAVEEAYKSGKRIRTQNRINGDVGVLVRGESSGQTIYMGVNVTTRKLETAYPAG